MDSVLHKLDMDYLKVENERKPLADSWDALESYFACISECSMNDHECVSSCLDEHLNSDNEMSPSLASFLSGPANRNVLLTKAP